MEFFAASHRYLPFGPYLALGGAVAALYGGWLHWLITVWYPALFRLNPDPIRPK